MLFHLNAHPTLMVQQQNQFLANRRCILSTLFSAGGASSMTVFFTVSIQQMMCYNAMHYLYIA
jgi:hypothetical protein